MPANNLWTPYEADEYVSDAQLRVIAVLEIGKTQPTTRYAVLMDCCQSVTEMTHAQIRKRAYSIKRTKGRKKRGQVQYCACCRPKSKGEDNFEIVVRKSIIRNPAFAEARSRLIGGIHGWYPPSSVESGPWMWMDRG